ncbi:MAG: FIST C-terminal domain-containing protein [Gammaproteobacteria bacterium]|nr:FIST C-terminal domain-containing protein [Gammaproteobacteria bacterium]
MKASTQLFATFDEQAISTQLEAWQQQYPDVGILAFFPENEKEHIPALQKLCIDKSISLVGAVFPCLLSSEGFHQNGLLLTRFIQMPPYTLFGNLSNTGGKSTTQMDKFTSAIQKQLTGRENATLFLCFDAMVPNIASILAHMYLRLADRVYYTGVNAGSESFTPMPCLFDNEKILEDAVLAIVLDKQTKQTLRHGYRAPEKMLVATSTEGNRIDTIEWRPAFEIYQQHVKKLYKLDINKDNFYQYAVHFPFGIIRADEKVLVRIPVALQDDGSLLCVGEVPANSVLTLLEAPSPESSHTAEAIAGDLACEKNEDILTFYCAGRRMHFGEKEAINELTVIKSLTNPNNVVGALSLGEIGSSGKGGYPLFHNAAIVCYCL